MTAVRRFLDDLDAAVAKGYALPWALSGDQADDCQVKDNESSSACWTVLPDDAALIVAAVNALPSLTSVLRQLDHLADELEEDSRDAMRISADGRERGDREVHRINARHGRVAHHAASRIRAITAALTSPATEGARP